MDRVRWMTGCDAPEVSQYTGKNVYVGVLDSGVALHPDLKGRIAAFEDFTGERRPRASSSCYDDNGHGTHDYGRKNKYNTYKLFIHEEKLLSKDKNIAR